MEIDHPQSGYRWYILALGTITHVVVVAMARLSMPVLFPEISKDLGLGLAEIGTVWGMIGLAGLLTAFAYGMLGDKYGTKRTLGVACLLLGVTGALRGLAGGFTSLSLYMFLFGVFGVPLTFTTHKAAGQWFSGKQLGLANGILAMGMGIGITIGSMLSATVLSPWLGGWRNIMYLYGALSLVIGILWLTTRPTPRGGAASKTEGVSFRESLGHVVRLKHLWLLGITYMCLAGSSMALIGYLPTYLRDIGWSGVSADGVLAAMGAVSVIGVIPLAFLSDRIGRRKTIMYPSIVIFVVCTFLIPFTDGWPVWLMTLLIGTVREGLFAVLITMSMETEGVGGQYSGTALGLLWSFAYLGNFFSPPVGNTLAETNPTLAFVFWSVLSAIALVIFFFTRETGWKKKQMT